MPMFSESSRSKLITCHPDLQVLFFEVIKKFDCKVLEGHRGEEAQAVAVAQGASKLDWPNGKHNSMPSMAVDVAPYPVVWKDTSRFFWFAGFVMGTAEQLKAAGKMTYGVRFGGDWDRNYDINDEKGLRDLVHFELAV